MLFTTAKLWKQPKCPSIDEWIKKVVVHLHNGILLGYKKEWNFTICHSMDGLRGYYAKWNKSDRQRQIPYDFTYMWNLKFVNLGNLCQEWDEDQILNGYISLIINPNTTKAKNNFFPQAWIFLTVQARQCGTLSGGSSLQAGVFSHALQWGSGAAQSHFSKCCPMSSGTDVRRLRSRPRPAKSKPAC